MSLVGALKGTGRTGFGYGSTADEVSEGIDLRGKTFVVTGCNSGIGRETFRVLASRGAQVVAVARTATKAADTAAELGVDARPIACELSEPESVRACSRAIAALEVPIHGIFANAGIMAPPQRTVRHGLEIQFLTNHLGHFILVTDLLGSLAEDARVIVTSSDMHFAAPRVGVELDDLDASRRYRPWRAYGQSKVANILFARELARRFEGTRRVANAVHPGMVATPLNRHMHPVLRAGMRIAHPLAFKTPAEGAATQVYLGVHPGGRDVNGAYYSDCNPARSSRQSRDPELARALWQRSEALRDALLP